MSYNSVQIISKSVNTAKWLMISISSVNHILRVDWGRGNENTGYWERRGPRQRKQWCIYVVSWWNNHEVVVVVVAAELLLPSAGNHCTSGQRETHRERERARARASPWGHTALPSGSRTVRPRWRWWRAAWGSCHSSPCTETKQAICRPLPNTFPQTASIGWTCSSSKTCFKKTVLPTKYLGKTEAMGWRVERGVSTCFSDNFFVECGVFFSTLKISFIVCILSFAKWLCRLCKCDLCYINWNKSTSLFWDHGHIDWIHLFECAM